MFPQMTHADIIYFTHCVSARATARNLSDEEDGETEKERTDKMNGDVSIHRFVVCFDFECEPKCTHNG